MSHARRKPGIRADAELINEIATQELPEKNLEDLVRERTVVERLPLAANVNEIKIISGLVLDTVMTPQ